MNPPVLHSLTVSENFTLLVKAMGKQLCSDPILLDIPAAANYFDDEMMSVWLGQQERHRLANLKLAKRRNEWFAGRVCAKMAIRDYFRSHGQDVPHCLDIAIMNSEAGRPFAVVGRKQRILKEPEISISHSSGLAFALAAESSCGVDIQKISQTLIRVKERFCTDQEEHILSTVPRHADPLMQLAMLWAAKEAAKKALSIVNMPGFLDLVLICIEKTGCEEQLFIFNRYHRHARLASEIRVLATCFNGYGIGVCIP